MDTSERIVKVLSAVVKRQLVLDQLQDKNLVEVLPLNSIDALEVLIRVEGEFGIQIDDEDLSVDLVSSLPKLKEYIESREASSAV
jgi:acyl carrier protein